MGCAPPSYDVVGGGGPDHARWFEVEARVAGELVGRGSGRSKRSAEFAAARDALESKAYAEHGSSSDSERQ